MSRPQYILKWFSGLKGVGRYFKLALLELVIY